MKIVLAAIILAFAPSAISGERLVNGGVYSYINPEGVRHYSTKPPPPGSRDVRLINYSFIERTAPQQLQPAPARYHGGYRCTQDCSGHAAGYQWAERRGIEHPDDCGGNSWSFIEGCMTYAQEIQQEQIEGGECEDSDGDELCDW